MKLEEKHSEGQIHKKKMEKKEVLIIKTGHTEVLEKGQNTLFVSLGDVLRTTSLLNKYKSNNVTWATSEEAYPLLNGNPYINRLLLLDNWADRRELIENRFDILINLEKSPGICIFADEDLKAWEKFGFRYDPDTKQARSYEEAYESLAISFNLEQKKNNQRFFQELLFEMVGEKFNGEEYILGYQPKTQEIYDIGFNTQVGNKWPSKAWPMYKWGELRELLVADGFKISQQDEQKEILNNLYAYIDWINSCKILITNDSLGLHIALALKKKVLALFGPTPHNEIFFYGRGKSLVPNELPQCAPCFEPKCDKYTHSCISLISVEKVYQEVKNLINDSKQNLHDPQNNLEYH